MHRFAKIITAAVICIIAVILVVVKISTNADEKNDNRDAEKPSPISSAAARVKVKDNRQDSPVNQQNQIDAINQELVTADVEKMREEALEKIQDASVTYDAAELPTIRPYLESSDPVLRAAAVDAMLVLGDAAAGPMLREAAQRLESEDEAKQMIKAADYIELPPADIKEMADKIRKNHEANKPR